MSESTPSGSSIPSMQAPTPKPALQARLHEIGSVLTLLMPLFLIALFSTQMAIGQMRSKADAILAIPEYRSLAEVSKLKDAEDVILRGRLIGCAEAGNCAEQAAALAGLQVPGPEGLLVYQVRPAEDRSARFREEFPLIFPSIVLELEDGGQIEVLPRAGGTEKLIYHEPRSLESEDFTFTGFQVGDELSVQGLWPGSQADAMELNDATSSSERPQLREASGVSGLSKVEQDSEALSALSRVERWRNVSAVFALLGAIFGLLQVLLRRRERSTATSSTSKPALPTK